MPGYCPSHLRLETLVSAPRFATYRQYAEGVLGRPSYEVDATAARLYMWNASVAAAYMPAIALTEVAVRNAMNDVTCQHHRVSRSVGWHSLALEPYPRIALVQRDLEELRRNRDRLESRIKRTATGDELVGASSLGAWTMLLDHGDSRDARLNYHDTIWVPYLHRAFPRIGTDSSAKGTLRNQLRQFQELRNRCAHHEPLLKDRAWHEKKVRLIADLARYIDSELGDYIQAAQSVLPVADQLNDYLAGECYL